MYEKLFTRPACFLGNVVDKMTDDLSKYKNCLSIDPDSIAQRVVETYYARCSDKDFERIFKAYWKFVFQESSDSQIIGDRDLNFLVLRTLTRYDRFKFSEKLIKNGKIFDVTSIVAWKNETENFDFLVGRKTKFNSKESKNGQDTKTGKQQDGHQ